VCQQKANTPFINRRLTALAVLPTHAAAESEIFCRSLILERIARARVENMGVAVASQGVERMKRNWAAAACAVLVVVAVAPLANADMISDVEGARARERAGYYLNSQDREFLRRYGSNDDYGRYGRRRYDGYYRPGIRVFIDRDGVYGPYGY